MTRTLITGKGMPLHRSDIDTDQIIPARFCYSTERTGFGTGLFGDWREDPDFVLNNPAYNKATVLVAGSAFATGSSREYAVWALKDYGFKVIIAESFGDIFTRNAVINDLLPIKVSAHAIKKIWQEIEANPETELVTDLETMKVSIGNISFPLAIEPSLKRKYVLNEDEITRNLHYIQLIDTLAEQRHPQQQVTRGDAQKTEKRDAIAIIGSGPRGMSVLERLAARLIDDEEQLPTDIFLIDDALVGTGRVWHPQQSENYIMNTVAPEISAFSGPWSAGPARPGCGPSFAQWLELTTGDFNAYDGYAPRAKYGQYLMYVLATVEDNLPPHVNLVKINDEVIDLIEENERLTLVFKAQDILAVDTCVLATGYQRLSLKASEQPLLEANEKIPNFTFHPGDSAAEMPLHSIQPGEATGVIGLGLSFFDVAAELTLGRGGKFVESTNGTLTYQASGKEPKIIAGSRSGMPILPRGRNQKPFDYEYHPAIFTQSRAADLRARGGLHFDRDCLPLIEAELTLVHAEVRLRNSGDDIAADTLRNHVKTERIECSADVAELARTHGLRDPEIIDLKQLANPFTGCTFASRDEFTTVLKQRLEAECAEALRGNLQSPIKAALDVLRNTRSVVRTLVDFGGLDPHSHKTEFLGWFAPATNFLAAGPPVIRTRQLLAWMNAGIVEIAGPDTRFVIDYSAGEVSITSPAISNSSVIVNRVVDARIPVINLNQDKALLSRALRARGMLQSFVSDNGQDSFDTGGVLVTRSPFNPIGKDGRVAHNVFVLGMPTEHIRWFMQSGSSRPTKWIDFMIDADAIASAALIVCRDRKKQSTSTKFPDENPYFNNISPKNQPKFANAS
ncbi:3-isopropylmalate dehydratase small subunit [Rhizobium sp.]|jgi:3-isopropylmalate dehydratase small subunit|uniref:3-isopropylmalate dehydratase small subunit n=1 Tax=Rhizobium sp. TaxID=391 RepID=UPI000E93DB0E|nr:3-isopropylmalate dehydratase small subunit [Rhizobium sp.]